MLPDPLDRADNEGSRDASLCGRMDSVARRSRANSEFRLIVVAYVGCLLVGQMLKPEIGGAPITVVDLLIAVLLPVILIRLRAQVGVFIAISVFLLPTVIYGAYYRISGQLQTSQLVMGVYSCYRFLLPLLLVLCYARRIGPADRRFCLRILLLGLMFHVVFGIVQAAMLPNFAIRYGPKTTDWDVQGRRLVSTFLDPNLSSSLFYAGVLAILCRVARLRKTPHVGELVVVTGALIAGVLTASRGGALGFAAALLVFLLESPDLGIQRKFKWSAVVALLATILLLIFFMFFGSAFIEQSNRLGASNSSVAERLVNLGILAGVTWNHPLFGRGFNFLPFLPNVDFVSVTGNYADGGLLYLLASSGIIGVASVCVMFFFVARRFANPRVFIYPAGMLVIQSTTTSSMYYPLLTIFVSLMALGLDSGRGVMRSYRMSWLSSDEHDGTIGL